MKQAGYATAIAGKWQLTLLKDDPGYPQRLGFDESCLFGWHEGPRYYQPHIWENGQLRQDVADDYGPDIYCQYLIDFMTRNKARPFFALYSMALCHDVTDDLEQPVPFGPQGRYDSYPEMVAAMDERVGRIVEAVDELQLREKTLIVFYADNGTPARTIIEVRDGRFVRQPVVSQLGDRQIPGGKAQLTDWGTRVPVIASWPGKVRPGQVCEGLVDITDVYPTIVELAGAKSPRGSLDGRSFASQLLGDREATSREWVFAEHKGRSFVKDQRFKLYHDGEMFYRRGSRRIAPAFDRCSVRGSGSCHRQTREGSARLRLAVGMFGQARCIRIQCVGTRSSIAPRDKNARCYFRHRNSLSRSHRCDVTGGAGCPVGGNVSVDAGARLRVRSLLNAERLVKKH